jgi:hypothetical protein
VTISTDVLFSPIRNKTFSPSPQDIYDKAKQESGGSIRRAWDLVRENSVVREYFISRITDAIRMSRAAQLIVVEGYILSDLYPELKAALTQQV